MTMKQQPMKKKSAAKLALSTLSLSALLALSACSGGDNKATDEPAAVTETETVVVEPETPVVEPEVVTPEPMVEPEPAEVPVVETEAAAEPVVLTADTGAKLYEKQCKVCHENGLLAAPKFGNKTDWAPHLVKDIETLRMHSAKGFNKMPAQANAEVSEAEVYAAVDYMVAAVS